MIQNSFPERCVSNENRDHMLTLSTQSQDDEQTQIKWNATENLDDQNLLLYMQLEDSSSSKTAAKLGVKNTQKEKLSQVLKEINRATTTNIKSPQQNTANTIGLQKKQINSQNYEDINDSEDDNLSQQQPRRSSILSIYCKKNDITFISSPEEFALKYIDNTNNLGEESPHISQLQIEMIISNKDEDEIQTSQSHSSIHPVVEKKQHYCAKNNSQQTIKNDNKQNQNVAQDQISIDLQNEKLKQSQNLNRQSHVNVCSEIENCFEEDDEYDFLISSPQSSSLQNAIQRHSSIIKQYEIQSENCHQSKPHTSSTMNAYDLLISLQKNIKDY